MIIIINIIIIILNTYVRSTYSLKALLGIAN